jgi:hypothetical protein
MIPDIAYERYAPTLIQVDSLKINVRDTGINDDPRFLTDQQSLIAGRHVHGGCNLYNMIVDHEGVMINAPLHKRTELADQYSLYVDGNVFVTGDITSGGSNFQGREYDPRGIFECVSAARIADGNLVEVTGEGVIANPTGIGASSNIVVRMTGTEFSTSVFGICTSSSNLPRSDGRWRLDVQTAGIGVVRCQGPVNIGDMLTSDASGIAKVSIISGEIIDTAIHNYTIGKALQTLSGTGVGLIRMLFNVLQAPPLGGTGVSSDGFWELGFKEANSIFYAGNVTVGNDYASRSNMYAVNIVKSADRTINHAHINIENTQASQFRMGIIGTASNSPAVIASAGGNGGIEFHAGRQQNYFERMYTVRSGGSDVYHAAEVPNYAWYANPEDAPHLKVGTDGNVGIHTSINPELVFQIRTQPNGFTPTVRDKMALHVQGNTYTSNMLIWDYDTGRPRNIDELYVRREGVTHLADSIIPGTFGRGGYYFRSNLGVGGNRGDKGWDDNYALKVHDDASFTSNLYVDGTLDTNNLVTMNSQFIGDVRADNDIVVGGTLRLQGGLMVEVPKTGSDGLEYLTWEAVDFRPVGSNSNQFYTVGNGMTTSGRLGVGMPATDAYARNNLRSQFVVNKINPSVTSNIWEVEMKDLSSSQYTAVAWMGHPYRENPQTSSGDASLFIATPCNLDANYRGSYTQGIDTNIYFYPGKGSLAGVDTANPPTLGVFHTGKVGIGVNYPTAELDVKGSIKFSDKLLFIGADGQELTLGLWKSGSFVSTSNAVATFPGIQYNDPSAPHVGINMPPQEKYGVVMGSNIKFVGGMFDQTNSKLAKWWDGNDAYTVNTSQSASVNVNPRLISYTWAHTGIGVTSPTGDLDIKNNNNETTTLRLLSSDVTNNTAIHMKGMDAAWRLQTHDIERRFEIAYDANNLAINSAVASNVRRPLWAHWTASNKPQTFIGCTLGVLASPEASTIDRTASLIVDGGMSVIGDVNITGSYKQSGQIMLNPDPAFAKCNLDLGIDDVYIGGGHVLLNPVGNKTVVIGNPNVVNEQISQANSAMLRVYQSGANPIASFRTSGNEGLVEVFSYSTGEVLRFGVLSPLDANRSNCPFAFLDGTGEAYLAFRKAFDGSSAKYVGFNTLNPQAMMHVTSPGTGSNMFKLTTKVNDQFTTSACAELELEKLSTGANPQSRSWTFAGPNSAYNDKLGLLYGSNNTKKEVFCFTNDGCLGIGTSSPVYAVDVRASDGVGGLRLANNGSTGTPQILLQSGSGVFGDDGYQDYRIYSSNSEFSIESVGTANDSASEPLTIWHVASNGYMGLLTQADSNYQVNIEGILNVTGGIYLNGSRLFSITSNTPGTNAYLEAENVYLQPSQANNGGLHINTAQTVKSGNLIYIRSGNDANMMVFDSAHTEAQMHMRTLSDNGQLDTWRTGVQGTKIYWELATDGISDLFFPATHDAYTRAFDITASDNYVGEFEATLNGRMHMNVPRAGLKLGDLAEIRADPSCNLTISSTSLNIRVASGFSNIATLWNSNGTVVTTFDRDGRLGIGIAPRASLDVASGQIWGSNGSLSLPTYSFANSSNTGISMSGVGVSAKLAICVNGSLAATLTRSDTFGTEGGSASNALVVPSFTCYGVANILGTSTGRTAIAVDSAGRVGIGTSIPMAPTHIESNVVINGNAWPLASNTWNLGTTALPWRNAYVSQTLNVNGTVMSNVSAGDLAISIGTITPRITLGSIVVNSNAASPSGLSFTTNVIGGGSVVAYPLVMDTSNLTSIEGLRLTTSNVDPLRAFTSNADNIATFASTEAPNAFAIKSTGYVGIGTNVPWAPLTVLSSNVARDSAFTVLQRGNGYLASFSNTTNAGFFVSNNGSIGVGTSVIENALQVRGSGYVDGNFIGMSNMYVNNDLVVAGNTFTRFDQIVDSDRRLKSDLRRIENALDKVAGLTGYTYEYTAASADKTPPRKTGLIAQEVLDIMPEAVGSNLTTGMYGVEYGSLMGLIVEAIKELRSELGDIKRSLHSPI